MSEALTKDELQSGVDVANQVAESYQKRVCTNNLLLVAFRLLLIRRYTRLLQSSSFSLFKLLASSLFWNLNFLSQYFVFHPFFTRLIKREMSDV